MIYPGNWHGQVLNDALQEEPALVLSCYSYGWMLRKQHGGAISEYPVDPAAIATALAANITFDTGVLDGGTLLVRQAGVTRLVVGYRKPQLTGLFIEGRAVGKSVGR